MGVFNRYILLAFCVLMFGLSIPLHAQLTFELESGVADAQSNDVRIPNQTGTLFSLVNDFKADSKVFFRIRLGYGFAERHHLILLIAPFSLTAKGQAGREILFNDDVFAAGHNIEGTYTFNSYRLTYRYDLKRSSNWIFGIGFTAKIRDAGIRVDDGATDSNKTNVGFVPLLHLYLQWNFADRWSLILDGDALAAPGGQGRAEDVLIALQFDFNKRTSFKAGYRLLEGGANVDEVYNFAWINYLVLGVTFTF